MDYVPVTFPSEAALQQAWDLLKSKADLHGTFIGHHAGKPVLGFTAEQVEAFHEADIPFNIVDELNSRKETDQ